MCDEAEAVVRNHDLGHIPGQMNTGILATVLETSIATLLLLFASFLAFSGKARLPSARARALAGLTAAIGLSVAFSLLGSLEDLSLLRQAKPVLALLTGPALYLYVSGIRRDPAPATGREWWHLAPATAGLILQAVQAGFAVDAWITACTGAYWAASVLCFMRFRDRYQPVSVRRFVIALLAIFGSVWLLDTVLSIQASDRGAYRQSIVYLVALGATLAAAIALMWTTLRSPRLQAVYPEPDPYSRSGLEAGALDSLAVHFDNLLQGKKLYLQEDVSLGTVAALLRVPPRYVSQLVNTRYRCNFSTYVNRLRIHDAARQLEASDASVAQIMYAVGFGSKSSFNREFKRVLGVSPKAWRSHNRHVPAECRSGDRGAME